MEKDIKSMLIGKNISHYNGFTGSSNWFKITRVEVYEDSVKVLPDACVWGIYIPVAILNDLLNEGRVETLFTVEGCSCREEWTING